MLEAYETVLSDNIHKYKITSLHCHNLPTPYACIRRCLKKGVILSYDFWNIPFL